MISLIRLIPQIIYQIFAWAPVFNSLV